MPAGLRWVDLGTAAAIGALALVDPAPLRQGARAVYRGAIAALAAATTWDALGRPAPARRPAPMSRPGDDDDHEFGPYGEFGAHPPLDSAGRRGAGARDLQVRVAYTAGAAGLA